MLLSRHRIGEYMPEVVHRGPDPAAIAVCQDVLDKPGVECVIIRGSRGLGGWDERSNLDLNVIHEAATDSAEPGAALGRAMDRHYRDSFEEPYNPKHGSVMVTLDPYRSRRWPLNHHMARAARNWLIFRSVPVAEDRYRHDRDTSNGWDVSPQKGFTDA